MPKVEVLSGKSKGEIFSLDADGEFKIGNRRGVPIPIRDSGVSFTQALIIGKGGAYEIRDHNSKKGTSVDGRQLSGKQTIELKGGETIELGGAVKLMFLGDGQESASAVADGGAAASAVNAELEAKIEDLEEKVSMWRGRAKAAQEEAAELAANADSDAGGDDLTEDLEKAEREVSKLKGKLSEAEDKTKEFQDKYDRTRRDMDQYKRRANDESKRADKLQKQVTRLEEKAGGGGDNDALKSEAAELRSKTRELEAQIEDLTAKEEEASSLLRGVERERDKLAQRMEDLESEMLDVSGGGSGGRDSERVKELEAQVRSLRKQADEQINEHADAEEAFETEIEDLKKKIEELETEIADLEAVIEESGA